MSTAADYPHLSVENGTARVAGTRYTVLHLAAEHYHYGWTAEELLRQHPDLRPEEVYAALTYFYDHFDRLVDEMKATADEARKQAGAATTFSRAELLQRTSSRDS
ncbi:MAG: DUF433 domain-containing protein [Planctomycetes bacterium]|nr:DUF433 domain-containing protein [Planctomycetota bacterium]